ncbi:uncharacterized protein LOC117182332 [Belonocnema kinseyi]|uniref:uncharacterized protein LOC117182332 n=1 Tax=Belonocnema kinseyi TaxID=2817044 RepID=UPI00143CDF0C|nr:uncharacterized protein LOC117182332 [Belonocnema kinseyi]
MISQYGSPKISYVELGTRHFETGEPQPTRLVQVNGSTRIERKVWDWKHLSDMLYESAQPSSPSLLKGESSQAQLSQAKPAQSQSSRVQTPRAQTPRTQTGVQRYLEWFKQERQEEDETR